MQLLNIFHTGGITMSIGLFYAIVSAAIWYQIAKQNNDPKNVSYKQSVWKNPLSWLFIFLTLVVIAAFVFIIGPDYKGV